MTFSAFQVETDFFNDEHGDAGEDLQGKIHYIVPTPFHLYFQFKGNLGDLSLIFDVFIDVSF